MCKMQCVNGYASRSSWTVQLEDFPFSLYIVAASESDEGLVFVTLFIQWFWRDHKRDDLNLNNHGQYLFDYHIRCHISCYFQTNSVVFIVSFWLTLIVKLLNMKNLQCFIIWVYTVYLHHIDCRLILIMPPPDPFNLLFQLHIKDDEDKVWS